MIELSENEKEGLQKYGMLCKQKKALEKKKEKAEKAGNQDGISKYQWQIKATERGLRRTLGLLLP